MTSSSPHNDQRSIGPLDRESFFAAQARHRRVTWKISLLCLIAVILLGIPLSIIITPALWGIGVICSDLLNIALPLPDLYTPVFTAIDSVLGSNSATLPMDKLMFLLFVCFGTGSLVFAFLYWLTCRIVLRAGSQAILTSLAAREPNLQDLEEQQLVNVVEEMAIAAGLSAPAVKLYDGPTANAAVFGRGTDEATIVVARKLLDDLDRDETQGVVGRLLGSISNGDMKISMLILSLFLVLSVGTTLLGGSTDSQFRALIRRFFATALKPRGNGSLEAELIHRIFQLDDKGLPLEDESNTTILGWILTVLKLPFVIMHATFGLVRTILMLFLLGPLLSWLWRTRCYLADAVAVQLTRNPDGLARGLKKLGQDSGLFPGSRYVAHLFVVGAEITAQKKQQRRQERLQTLKNNAKAQIRPERISTIEDAHQTQQNDQEQNAQAADQGSIEILSLLPPLAKRLQKLGQMGSTMATEASVRKTEKAGMSWKTGALLFVIMAPLAGIMLMLVYAIIVLSTMLGLGAGMAILMAALGILHPLLRML